MKGLDMGGAGGEVEKEGWSVIPNGGARHIMDSILTQLPFWFLSK